MCSGYPFSSEPKSHYVFFLLPLAINLITHSHRSFLWCFRKASSYSKWQLFFRCGCQIAFLCQRNVFCLQRTHGHSCYRNSSCSISAHCVLVSVLPPLRNNWKLVEETSGPIGKELMKLFIALKTKFSQHCPRNSGEMFLASVWEILLKQITFILHSVNIPSVSGTARCLYCLQLICESNIQWYIMFFITYIQYIKQTKHESVGEFPEFWLQRKV